MYDFGAILLPLEESNLEAGGSPELDMATSVVNYAMSYIDPNYTHELSTPEGTTHFKDSIRMVFRHFRFSCMENLRSSFNAVFSTAVITTRLYRNFFLQQTFDFIGGPYDHIRFLMWCTEMCTNAGFLYEAGHRGAPNFVVRCILGALWPLRIYWYQDHVDFNAHWMHLEAFCSSCSEGLLIHPILEYYPDAADTAELHFAIDVVNHIVRCYAPNWKHQLREELASAWFTPEIRRVIEGIRLEKAASFRADFDRIFRHNDVMTDELYGFIFRSQSTEFKRHPYDHGKFLEFCTEISMFAVFLYEAERPPCLDFAVLNILLAVWPPVSFGNQSPVPFHVLLNQMDQYCRRLEGTTENQG